MKKHEATRQFLNSKALTYDGSGASGVPDTPYECRHCGKGYKHFSSLMQHQVNNKIHKCCHTICYMFLERQTWQHYPDPSNPDGKILNGSK